MNYYRMSEIYGEGPTHVVLLHGWGFHSGIWEPLLNQFTSDMPALKRFTFHCIDLPGFGRSREMVFVADAHYILETLLPYLPPRAIYVGWSMGGLFALLAGIKYPERVQSLFMLASTPCFLEKSNWKGVSIEVFDRFYHAVCDDPEKALSAFILFGLAVRTDQKKYYHSVWDSITQHGLPSQATLLEGLAFLKKTDMRQLLSQLSCPTYFVRGECDPMTPPMISSNLHHLKTIVFPAVGHMPHITAAAAVLDCLSGFFSDRSHA